jgi:hypothetical protein
MPQETIRAGPPLNSRSHAALGILVLALIAISACVRTKGRNADCRWPGEIPLSKGAPAHLSADAEFAEDLAIRYADTHAGLRTPGWESAEAYNAARDRCAGSLFEEIARQHGVPAERVSASLGSNRGVVDLAINLPFFLLYLCLASWCGRFIWRKYPVAEHGWIPGAVMASFMSVALALGCTMLGETWALLVETYRIGNGHSIEFWRLWHLSWRLGSRSASMRFAQSRANRRRSPDRTRCCVTRGEIRIVTTRIRTAKGLLRCFRTGPLLKQSHSPAARRLENLNAAPFTADRKSIAEPPVHPSKDLL